MPIGLSLYAQQFLTNEEAARRELQFPVLIWESAGKEDLREEQIFQTQVGLTGRRPKVGDPLVYAVKKAGNKANAFAMGISIGRAEHNDIFIDDESVSRFHAWLQQDTRTGAWKLVDAESTNGSWLGALKLQPNRAEEVRFGSKLRFGNVEMTFLSPAGFFEYLERVLRGVA